MSFLDRVRGAFGYEPPVEEPQSLLQQLQSNVSQATTLSTQQRLWCFGGSMLVAVLCYSLGTISLMFFYNVRSGIMFFTLGNIACLAATFFIVGPKKQLQTMFTRERMASAFAFVGAMVLTFVAAVKCRDFFEVVIFVVPCVLIQLVAILWYCSTYVPGGQGFFKSAIGAANFETGV